MVKVTDRAKAVLKSALARTGEEPGTALRVEMSEEGSYGLFPDRKKAGDQVVDHDGDALLLIGQEDAEPLDGATIDLADTPDGARLVLTRPSEPDDAADGVGPDG